MRASAPGSDVRYIITFFSCVSSPPPRAEPGVGARRRGLWGGMGRRAAVPGLTPRAKSGRPLRGLRRLPEQTLRSQDNGTTLSRSDDADGHRRPTDNGPGAMGEHGAEDSTCWTLLRDAAAGGEAPRAEFAARYAPVVRAYLAARWRGSHLLRELDDTVQDVFIECLR